MDENPTSKRLRILKNLMDAIEKQIFEGILLVGSMSFGKYCVVRPDSDIDLIFIIKKEHAGQLMNQEFFTKADYFTPEKPELLSGAKTDGFWLDQHVDGVLINMGIYLEESFERFCRLEKKDWRLSTHKASWNCGRRYRGVDGRPYEDVVEVKKNKQLYIRIHHLFSGEIFIGGSFAGNLLLGEILYDKKGTIFRNIQYFKKLLAKRYGPESAPNLLGYVIDKLPDNKRNKVIESAT